MGTRREKVFRLAKGFRGRRKNCYRITIHAVHRALKYGYVSRRLRKRDTRKTWITQINAGSKEHGLSYAKLIFGLTHAEIGLNRKMLALLAQQEPYTFRAIVDEAKFALRKVAAAPDGEAAEGSASAGDAAGSASAPASMARGAPTTLIGLALREEAMEEEIQRLDRNSGQTEDDLLVECLAEFAALSAGDDGS